MKINLSGPTTPAKREEQEGQLSLKLSVAARQYSEFPDQETRTQLLHSLAAFAGLSSNPKIPLRLRSASEEDQYDLLFTVWDIHSLICKERRLSDPSRGLEDALNAWIERTEVRPVRPRSGPPKVSRSASSQCERRPSSPKMTPSEKKALDQLIDEHFIKTMYVQNKYPVKTLTSALGCSATYFQARVRELGFPINERGTRSCVDRFVLPRDIAEKLVDLKGAGADDSSSSS